MKCSKGETKTVKLSITVYPKIENAIIKMNNPMNQTGLSWPSPETKKACKINDLQALELFWSENWWRWPESNRCPNITVKSFLHAYFRINCREITGTEQTNYFLSWISLGNSHSLLLQQSVSVWFRRSSWGTDKPACSAKMGALITN